MSNLSRPPNVEISRLTPAALAAGAGLLVVAVVLVYAAGLNGGYVFDDFHNIVNNSRLRVTDEGWRAWLIAAFSGEAGPLQRPLAMLSFAANIHFGGLDPMPMKAANIAIHAVNTLLVLGLSRQLVRAAVRRVGSTGYAEDSIALAIAACWALHPINLMAVLYIVQRMESLCHTFVFAGLWMYLAGRQRQMAGKGGWLMILGGIVGGTTLGAMSKESAVLLPLYAFLAEATLFGFRAGPKDTRNRPLLLFFVAVLLVPALLAVSRLLPAMLAPRAYAIRDFTMAERLMTESRVLLDYIRWTLFPDLSQLSLYHDDYVVSRGLLSPPSTIVCLLVIPALLALAWAIRKRRPLIALGIAWFFAAQLITGTFIPLELVYEHRNYFASLGICLVVADLLALAPSSATARRTGLLLLGSCALLLGGQTFLRASEWNHPLRFAMTESAKHPQSPRAAYDIARLLVRLSNYDASSPYARDAWPILERASRLPGSNILAEQAALILAGRTGQPQDHWWKRLQGKLRTQRMGSQNTASLIALTECAVQGVCAFRADDMLATYAAALENSPDAGVLSMYGTYAIYVLRDPKLGLQLWEEAARRGPENAQFHVNLAMLLIDLRQFDRASEEIRALRQLSRIGMYESLAGQLETRMQNAKRADAERAASK